MQVLNFRSWTFFFGLAFVVGLYSLHRLSFVHETSGTTDPLLVRDLLLEARRRSKVCRVPLVCFAWSARRLWPSGRTQGNRRSPTRPHNKSRVSLRSL